MPNPIVVVDAHHPKDNIKCEICGHSADYTIRMNGVKYEICSVCLAKKEQEVTEGAEPNKEYLLLEFE